MNNYVVYKHECPNGKIYIGITGNTPEKRWLNGYGYRHNNHFYNAIKKYGWGNIKHDILEYNLDYETATIKEVEYIKKYDSINPKKGYNKMLGGIYQNSVVLSKMKQNSSAAKPIICIKQIYDYDYENYCLFVHFYSSIAEASENLGVSKREIGNSLKSHKIDNVYMYFTENEDTNCGIAKTLLKFKKGKLNVYKFTIENYVYFLRDSYFKEKIKFIKYYGKMSHLCRKFDDILK